MTTILLVAAVAAMLAAALVSGFETGIYALSHIRLRYRLSVNDRRARMVETLLARPQQLLAGILLAQNAAIYFTTAVVAALFQLSGLVWAEGLSTVLLAVVFFVFVEAVPKNVFRRAADVLVYPLAKPFVYLAAAMRPAGSVLRAITRLAARLGAEKREISDPFFTRERLAFYLREGLTEGILSDYQVELTHNILRGEKVTVARAMVPLDKVTMLPFGAPLVDFRQLSRANRFARYPVYRDSRENVVGVVNIYDCYLLQPCAFDLDMLMRPPVVFAPDVRVTEAVKTLREARQPMGVVVDGQRAIGIVTLKDCLEEIVGELYAW